MSSLKTIIIVFIVLLLQACTLTDKQKAIVFENIVKPYEAISPKISFIKSLNSGLQQAEVNKLWALSDSCNFPLIEKDPLDKDMLFVSLLYRDSTENIDVEFEVFGIYADNSLGDKKLIPIENTDLWYRTYKMPNDICFSYRFIITDSDNKKTHLSDPLNNRRIPHGELKSYTYSVFDLSLNQEKSNKFTPQVKHGKLHEIQFDSKILNNSRKVYIYLPPDYDSTRTKPYPVIYLFDGFLYRNRIETPNILDNLIAEKKIELMAAVIISRSSKKERQIELALYPPHTEFMLNELMPFIESKFNLSSRASERIIGGISYGGLTAAYVAFIHPELFGKVLSQSGSFWRSAEVLEDGSVPDYRHDYLIEKFITSPKKKLELYLDWGLQENWVLGSNRRMVKVLKEKNYEFKYNEFNGWHDWANSRKSFVDGIVYLVNEK